MSKAGPGRRANAATSDATTVTTAAALTPSAATFARMAVRAARSRSTSVTGSGAARDSSSSPSAPLPAYRSSTAAPSTPPAAVRALPIAARTRSDVGLGDLASRRDQPASAQTSGDDPGHDRRPSRDASRL